MLGAATGDTIGSVYEFHNTKDYNFRLFLGQSAYTDDSIMTMAVAYRLMRDPEGGNFRMNHCPDGIRTARGAMVPRCA